MITLTARLLVLVALLTIIIICSGNEDMTNGNTRAAPRTCKMRSDCARCNYNVSCVPDCDTINNTNTCRCKCLSPCTTSSECPQSPLNRTAACNTYSHTCFLYFPNDGKGRCPMDYPCGYGRDRNNNTIGYINYYRLCTTGDDCTLLINCGKVGPNCQPKCDLKFGRGGVCTCSCPGVLGPPPPKP